MKILGWMHRKLRQHSSESPVRDFATGQPSLDDQQFYWKQNGLKPVRQNYRDYNLRKSFPGLESTRDEEEDSKEDQLTAYSDLFHGFLAIGTLGGDPTIHDASTPKFSISIENMTENENDVSEIELKQFNDELERVLEAEAREDISNNSSRRNSYVSTGRSSHASTITLSEKPMEGTETNVNASTSFPLQGYLFGSRIEVSETAMAKREDRASLGELFQRTKLADENYSANNDRKEKGREKEGDKSAVRIMKKILRTKMQHASKTSTGAVDAASSETKLRKIMKMFHRKVHPENSEASTQNLSKPHKNEANNKISYDAQYINGDQTLSEENILIPQRDTSKRSIHCYKSQSNQTRFTLSRCDSNENKEYWIKTDLDYLVLEL